MDPRLDRLAVLAESKETVYTDLKVVDIAGLVRGASKGEGLGNQFLANIRETDAILHVVRCFEDPNVVHVEQTVDPARDIEIRSQQTRATFTPPCSITTVLAYRSSCTPLLR